MYTITLSDGTVLTDLDMNGTNYVSKTEVNTSIFTDKNLEIVTISDGETTETYTDLVFIQQMKWMDGTYYLAFREKTEQEKLAEKLLSNSDDITDAQMALADIYEIVIGG